MTSEFNTLFLIIESTLVSPDTIRPEAGQECSNFVKRIKQLKAWVKENGPDLNKAKNAIESALNDFRKFFKQGLTPAEQSKYKGFLDSAESTVAA